MQGKYKPGIENWDKLAICKVNGAELKYEDGAKHVGLKQYITKLGIKTDDYLSYYDIVDNPYKDIPRCSCKICDKTFKDGSNKSGMLTVHINKIHNTSIEDYVERFPEDLNLFNTYKLALDENKYLMQSEDNRIQCPICKEYMRTISRSHTEMHGMSPEDFKTFTGLTSLMSKASEEKSRETYYTENGLHTYKKPKTKPEKVKKEVSKVSKKREIKSFMAGVDYHTYDYETLKKDGIQVIYKITSPSGKCYIGRAKDFYVRMRTHKHSAENPYNNGVYSAIRKYGWENMTFEIIDVANNKYEAIEKELKWILFFDSYRNGYNRTLNTKDGGCPVDPSDIEAYAAYIKKQSDVHKGQIAPNKGIPMSEETKQRMKEKAKGRFSLEWFIERNGEELGKEMYQARVTKLENRTDQTRDSKGNFIKKVIS